MASLARITPQDLTAYDFSARRLRLEGGFDAYQLRQASFDIFELKEAGFNAVELRSAGFDVADLKVASFSCEEIRNAGFSLSRLRSGGFSADLLHYDLHLNIADLKGAGYTSYELKGLFSLSELKTAGFNASEVVGTFPPTVLVRNGYTKEELKPLFSWPHDGQWQLYNQYWDCCFSLDSNSTCCGVTRPVRSSGTEQTASTPRAQASVKEGGTQAFTLSLPQDLLKA